MLPVIQAVLTLTLAIGGCILLVLLLGYMLLRADFADADRIDSAADDVIDAAIRLDENTDAINEAIDAFRHDPTDTVAANILVELREQQGRLIDRLEQTRADLTAARSAAHTRNPKRWRDPAA